MLTNRVEFVVAVNAISKLGAAAVLLSPAWKAAEVDHALSLTAPARRGRRRSRRRTARPTRLGTTRRPTSTTPRRLDARSHATATSTAAALPTTTPSSCSARARPACRRRCATRIARWRVGTAHWCAALGLGPDDRFQVATPPSHILGLLNLLAATEAGATVRLHRRFDLDEVLHRIESDRMTLEMAVAPIAPRHGEPPATSSGTTSARSATSCGARRRSPRAWRPPSPPAPASASSRPTAPASCRSSPATRSATRRGGGSTPPGCRPPASSCASPTSTPAPCSPPARSARSKPAARRAWRATSPRPPTPRRSSTTAGTAPATSAGSSPRVGCTSPTGRRR